MPFDHDLTRNHFGPRIRRHDTSRRRCNLIYRQRFVSGRQRADNFVDRQQFTYNSG